MIPGNIELPDEMLRKLSADPILLRWLSEVQAQLVTSVIETNGVGSQRFIRNDTGSVISEGAEAPGAQLSLMGLVSGAWAPVPVVLTGDWINSSGYDIQPGDSAILTRLR